MDEMDLRDLNVPGFVRFSIKAKDTPENTAVHKAFKDFCRVECEDNYTLGLKQLLTHIEQDFKYEMLHARLAELEEKLRAMTGQVKVVEVKESKVF